jgi:hypothetical protein
MFSPAVYLISVLLFLLSGFLLFAAGSSWAKVARHRGCSDDQSVPKASLRAVAGLTAAALGLLGAAILWAVAVAFLVEV